jgi:ankyrin repeat protein
MPSIVEVLLDSGVDPNVVAADGGTALRQAALRRSSRMVRILLANGGNPNAVDPDGFLPLHLAALSGSTDLIAELLKSGPGVSALTRGSRETWISLPRGAASMLQKLLLRFRSQPVRARCKSPRAR